MSTPPPRVALDPAFLRVPLAHRGLHGAPTGCPENSRCAFAAALARGYGIECDVQLSADDAAMVFHDTDLDRTAHGSGAVRGHSAGQLGRIRLRGGQDMVEQVEALLALVDGRVPLLIEIKDQSGTLGPETGALSRAVGRALEAYPGPVAVMSFNPHAVAAFGAAAPGVARGLVTDPYRAVDWPGVGRARLAELRGIPDAERLGISFISHNVADLDSPHVARMKAAGMAVLCWTVRSREQARAALKVADNITFEGFLPPRDVAMLRP